MAVSHIDRSLLVCCTDAASFRELLKILPRLLTGFSVTVGILVPLNVKWKLSATLPFFRTKDLDFAGLKLILAHVMSCSSP